MSDSAPARTSDSVTVASADHPAQRLCVVVVPLAVTVIVRTEPTRVATTPSPTMLIVSTLVPSVVPSSCAVNVPPVPSAPSMPAMAIRTGSASCASRARGPVSTGRAASTCL